MVDLVDNFLDIMNLFLAMPSNFIKSRWRMGESKERKINGASATTNQVKDG
jgi:hypothetical protein